MKNELSVRLSEREIVRYADTMLEGRMAEFPESDRSSFAGRVEFNGRIRPGGKNGDEHRLDPASIRGGDRFVLEHDFKPIGFNGEGDRTCDRSDRKNGNCRDGRKNVETFHLMVGLQTLHCATPSNTDGWQYAQHPFLKIHVTGTNRTPFSS